MASKAQKKAAKKAARAAKTVANTTKVTTVTPVTETSTPKVEEPKLTTPTPAPVATPANKPAEKPAETKPAPKKEPTKKEEVKTPKTSQSKEQPKPKEEKKPANKPTKKEKVPVLEAEEVDEQIPTLTKNLNQFNANGMANKDLGIIDTNHGIDLMTAIQKRYLSGGDAPEELKNAMSTQFDIMVFVNLMRWNAQTEHDLGEAGIVISKDVFDKIKASLATSLGITLKGLPTKDDSQMEIDFEGTVETASTEMKEAIEKEVKTPNKKEDDEPLPKYDSNMNEQQCVEALNTIAITHRERTIDQILQDMIDFTRKAWKLDKAEVKDVLSTMLSKIQDPKCFVIKTWSNIAYGSLINSNAPFAAHCNVRNKMEQYGYSEKQIAEITNFFIDVRNTTVYNEDAKLYEQQSEMITKLVKLFDQKQIKELIKDMNNRKSHVLPEIEGMKGDCSINTAKLSELLKLTYGNLNAKDLSKKLNEIAEFYSKAWN